MPELRLLPYAGLLVAEYVEKLEVLVYLVVQVVISAFWVFAARKLARVDMLELNRLIREHRDSLRLQLVDFGLESVVIQRRQRNIKIYKRIVAGYSLPLYVFAKHAKAINVFARFINLLVSLLFRNIRFFVSKHVHSRFIVLFRLFTISNRRRLLLRLLLIARVFDIVVCKIVERIQIYIVFWFNDFIGGINVGFYIVIIFIIVFLDFSIKHI